MKVKAAGGIKTMQDAEDMIALGADRLGTSRIVKLAIEMEKQAVAAMPSPAAPVTAPAPSPAPETPDGGQTPSEGPVEY